MALAKAVNYLLGMSKRERMLIGFAVLGITLFLTVNATTTFWNYLASTKQTIKSRRIDLQTIQHVNTRYTLLKGKLEELRTSFDDKRLTLEEVYSELDRIVKDSIKSNKYELKRRDVSETDLGYEKHNFQLSVKSITLDQLIQLLFELERQDRPIFLRKANISTRSKGTFQATLSLFTIQEQKT